VSDFDNGFLLGLAVTYKKAAEAIGLGDFLIITRADSVIQSTHIIGAHVSVNALQPNDVRPPTADSVDTTAVMVADAVQVIM